MCIYVYVNVCMYMYMYMYMAMTIHIYASKHIGETMAGGEDFLARRSRAKEDTSFPDEVRH